LVSSRRLFAALAALFVVAAAALAVAVVSGGSSSDRRESATARASDREREEGRFDPRKEAKFEGRGGEADRKGPENPVVEQVENRAYPRTYVDDARAVKSRKAFTSKPGKLGRSSFKTSAAYRTALAEAPGDWTALGPVTPNVSGEASQFFDPATQSGPPSQESGRVTALAIDPNCGKGSAPAGAPCRLWVAAAGGGIWRTDDALAAHPAWIAPPDDLETNAFGSLAIDPNDPTGNTIYAGSGEPNGSGDSEAGLGLFRSTDGGGHWTLLPGSSAGVALNRSIGAIAIKPGDPDTIYIGTDVARHGSSSSNGGRRTPPNAPPLGVYKSADGGASFAISGDLHGKTPQNPRDPAAGTGTDWFQGGITKLEFDPNDATGNTLYAAVVGYGLWRTIDANAHYTQVFHTMNQTNFADSRHPGDTFGDRTEFDAIDAGGKTRIYLGDSSDDWGIARVWRTNDAGAIAGDENGAYGNSGWTELSSSTNGTNGFLAYGYCQNGQCGYDDFVSTPAAQLGVGAGHEDELWLGGSMNYDELVAYAGLPPRSNGRADVRSTNAGADNPADVTWQDMTAQMDGGHHITGGQHPDLHAVVFASADPRIAFVGSDGGVVRVDNRVTEDHSAVCADRRWSGYNPGRGPQPLAPADLRDCQRLLSATPAAVEPINDGLNTIQFQSLSFDPNGTDGLLGGTQDNGTWTYSGSPAWFESVGGDGGQSGWDKGHSEIRYHNYYDATPEVNFDGDNPKEWLAIYDPLQTTKELRSFYVPFIADPNVSGRAFIGLSHVWRTNDNGGQHAYLEAHCNALDLDPFRTAPCGDWKAIGQDLSSTQFGQSRAGHYVVATERAPSDNATLWAATRIGRVFITKNADAANPNRVRFTRLDDSTTPGRFVSGISVDPADQNHAWISYSGYSAYTPSTPGHVFEVTYNPATGRARFDDRSYDMNDQPVTGIALADNGDVYAATDFGVLRLPAGATAWEETGGMPHVAVYGLTLDRGSDTLYAATHGRGAYSLGL
jgi:hypothetical protein